MKDKIINLIYNFSIAAAILSYLFFSFSMEIKKADAQAGLSWGGRITTVITETCPVVPNTVCGYGCCSGQCTTITPYGGAAVPIACLPATMTTTAAPVTPASSGGQILGLFSMLSQAAFSVPIGIVGTSI